MDERRRLSVLCQEPVMRRSIGWNDRLYMHTLSVYKSEPHSEHGRRREGESRREMDGPCTRLPTREVRSGTRYRRRTDRWLAPGRPHGDRAAVRPVPTALLLPGLERHRADPTSYAMIRHPNWYRSRNSRERSSSGCSRREFDQRRLADTGAGASARGTVPCPVRSVVGTRAS